MSKKVNVLYYHRIIDLREDLNQLCVTPAKFEQQMRYLKRNYEILRFEDEWEVGDEDGVVITFDDGYLDNLLYALPILEELEIPATIFVSTGTLEENRELWWDELEKLILDEGNDLKTISIKDEKYGCKWDIDTYELKLNCYHAIHYLMKNYINADIRNQWFKQLREQRKIDGSARNLYRTLDRESCMELAKSKYIAIGAHTVSHPSLARLSAAEQRTEIVNSKTYLESILNRKIEVFSYPFGAKGVDYGDDTIQICKSVGIRKAASTIPGIWTAGCSDCEIPRNVVRNWGISEFQHRIDRCFEVG